MLITILIVLVILWLVGAAPVHTRWGYHGDGGWLATLVVIIAILYVLGVR